MKHKLIYLIGIVTLMATSCDLLDRPSLTEADDASYWTDAKKVELYANSFYTSYFVGYGTKWGGFGCANSFIHNDDMVQTTTQSNFSTKLPEETGWSFSLVRKANVMIYKLKKMLKDGLLSEEDYKHWMGVARFFRGWEYADLVRAYGDVPYYDHVVSNSDFDDLFKDRDNRDDVMDAVLEDLEYAIENVKTEDGGITRINKYVVATIASRIALFEGSWQKYYYGQKDRAIEMFDFAVYAAQVVMRSGKYTFNTDFRSLFGSENLSSCGECLLERRYDRSLGVTHSVASYCNLSESVAKGANLDFVKSFICTDGKVWQKSDMDNADQFNVPNLVKTRDSRFEATFHDMPTHKNIATALYTVKFIPRSALKWTKEPEENWILQNNTNSYPVVRYAETVLNFIEAKAELETLGGDVVTQDDLDVSINAIRKRPIASEALEKGVQPTAPLNLHDLPVDPSRDQSVPALLWEIRRERRMEFFQELNFRFIDLKRWYKLEYMDTKNREDLLRGVWVNAKAEMPKALEEGIKLRLEKADGSFVINNGENDNEMKGYFRPKANKPRRDYMNIGGINLYLSPMGYNTIKFYADRGYTLSQTEGWPTEQ